jgi:hypothetical protein
MKKMGILSALLLVAIVGSALLWSYPSVFPHGTTIYKPDKAYSGYTIFSVDNFGAFLIDMRGNRSRRFQRPGYRRLE